MKIRVMIAGHEIEIDTNGEAYCHVMERLDRFYEEALKIEVARLATESRGSLTIKTRPLGNEEEAP